MLKLFLVFLILIHIIVLAYPTRFDSSRKRRVVNGYAPVVNQERAFEYEVIRYSAWIGLATGCTSRKIVKVDTPQWWTTGKRICFPDIDDQRCMGALIHPRIVQTAGHCVGSVRLTIDDPKNAWVPGRLYNVWEDMMQIFVGFTDIEDFTLPSYSKFFLQHPKYARLRNTQFDWISYDFGWITLDSEPVKLKFWPNLVAPVPTTNTLERETVELLKNEEVCLFSGFGAWKTYPDDIEIFNPTSSRYLRFGWQLTTSYKQCWYFLHELTKNNVKVPNQETWEYSEYASWFCHIPFGEHIEDHPAIGDSGTPVHCNGRMLALLSGGKWQNVTSSGSKRAHITRTSGLYYSMFENSEEFREYFVATLKYHARVRELYTFRPSKRPEMQLEYSMKSGNSGTIHVSYAISTIPIVFMIFELTRFQMADFCQRIIFQQSF